MSLQQRLRARSTRRAEQDRLRSIVERMADGIVMLGMDGRILFANPAARELFGRDSTELVGADLGFPAALGDSSEIEMLRPRGPGIVAEVRVVETQWDNEPARLVSLRDCTDRKRAEERATQLERERIARAEAEASSQAKSEFLATMSHELRTPLNAVIGYAELLDIGIAGELSPEQHVHVERIRNSARHLLGLVNEVLDLAKVEAGRLAVHCRATHAGRSVDAAQTLVQPAAELRGITLGGACGDSEVVYDGDEDRVRQIVLNLLNNAVKFTKPGGRVTVGCGVTSRRAPDARLSGGGPWVFIRIEDTGIGIPTNRIASIFDPFVQVEGGRTRSNDGSGLGLTISRRLARLMGGDLTVTSQLGKGSAFTLWLREANAVQRDAERWRAEAPDTAARLQGLSDVGRALLGQIPALVDSFVNRLRAEAIVPGSLSMRLSQLSDHVAAYVADIASMLGAIEDARGQPSRLVVEGAEIQSHIAERHGMQGGRLGWTAQTLHREWQILSDEIERGIRRVGGIVPDSVITEALIIVGRVLEQAEECSIRALERSVDAHAGRISPRVGDVGPEHAET